MFVRTLHRYVETALGKISRDPGYTLQKPEEEARLWIWEHHRDEIARLSACLGKVCALTSSPIHRLLVELREAVKPMNNAEEGMVSQCKKQLTAVVSEPAPASRETTVRLACANPSRLGFADAANRLSWTPLMDPNVGLWAAVDALGIDLVALTAPRLREEVCRLPGKGWRACCRGGPSYASTAVTWPPKLQDAVAPLEHIGNASRLWFGSASYPHLKLPTSDAVHT